MFVICLQQYLTYMKYNVSACQIKTDTIKYQERIGQDGILTIHSWSEILLFASLGNPPSQ